MTGALMPDRTLLVRLTRHLETADVVLLLVSPDFLNS